MNVYYITYCSCLHTKAKSHGFYIQNVIYFQWCCGKGGRYQSEDKTPISDDEDHLGYDGPQQS